MKNKINIAELLKDCPKGMELDCSVWDNVVFDHIDTTSNYPIYIKKMGGELEYLTEDGHFNFDCDAKCVIYPKGKTTWDEFVPPCQFKDGDVCYIKTKKFEHIFIFKVNEKYNLIQEHAGLCEDHFYTENPVCTIDDVKEHRLATEEEKQKLFGAIKANGYRWNEETKSLEKLPKFKDGDILFVKAAYSWIIIYKESENEGELYKYVGIPVGIPDYPNHTFMVYDCNPLCCKDDISEIRLATEEEKKKLFDAIKENSFEWNSETKTLENLVEPWTIQDANDGDILAFNDETIVIFKDLYNNTSFHSYCHIEDGIFTISKEDMPDWWRAKGFYPATEEQCTLLFRKIKEAGYHWNSETKTLEKVIQPKFKVGDKIVKKNGICVPILITKVGNEFYYSNTVNSVGVLSIKDQDDYELVPNKFDITTLKSFDKVLVRRNEDNKWRGTFFSHMDEDLYFHCYKYVTITGKSYPMCIPYEGNEHLSNTPDDCEEYFKTW